MTLLERAYRRCLVVVHVEDGIEPSDLQQVADILAEVHQFQFAAVVAQGGVVHHQLANARAVDVYDACEVQQNLAITVLHKLMHHVAQPAGAFTETELPADVHDRNSVDQTSSRLNCHPLTPNSY